MAVPLALLAALLFAVGIVFQQKADMDESDEAARNPGVLLRLLRKPIWLFGVASNLLGFGAQAAALGIGRLVIVQPLQVTSVVFALPLGARFTGQRIGRREVAGAVAVTAGLAAFVGLSNPSGGRADAPFHDWAVAGAVCGGVALVLAAVGFGRRPGLKAALLGTASGILFGLVAALTKATVDRLDDGIVAFLFDWHLYALVGVTIPAFWLTQASLQTGSLAPAIATAMSFDPVTSLMLGLFLFDERLTHSPARRVILAAALLVALAGLVVLAFARERAERELPGAAPPHAALVKPDAVES
jgi:drug/metabolite transporter (DMT)-like permease